jgi:cystathionine beta-lyase
VNFPMPENSESTPTFPLRPSYADFHNQLRTNSQVVVFDGAPDDPHHPSSTPIYQTSTFRQPTSSSFGPYDYTRSGNPTRTALEKHAAMLERATIAFGFSTGMTALSMVLRMANGTLGEEVLCCSDVYGGMYRLLTKVAPMQGVRHSFVDATSVDQVVQSLSPLTRVVHVETPSNPLMRICDLRRLSAALRPRGVLLSVDASAMCPLLMRPLDLGADVVVHSATKHFSGHADCMGGLVCLRDEALAERVAFLQNAEGTAIAPFESWLMLRGMKTMALRVERSQSNARKICSFLAEHPLVLRLYWPGPEGGAKNCVSEAEREIHASQSSGPGTLLSFETGSKRFSRRFMDACRIFKITVSFGSVHSLCEMPSDMSHAAIPKGLDHLPADLVRLSIGIEDWRDLRDDLSQALTLAASDLEDSEIVGHHFDSKFDDLPLKPVPH